MFFSIIIAFISCIPQVINAIFAKDITSFADLLIPCICTGTGEDRVVFEREKIGRVLQETLPYLIQLSCFQN